MNIPGTGPVQPFVTVAPYSPLGKPAVGQESPDTKDKPLPPVEEAEASTRSAQHRIGEDEGSAGGERRQGRSDQETQAEDGQGGETPAAAPELPELEMNVNALGAQLAMRARIDQARHAETAPPPADPPRLPPGSFETGAPPAPGTLLDQKI